MGLVVGLTALGPGSVSAAQATPHSPAPSNTSTPVKHLVVIYGENISFDHYFGTYPNAINTDGIPFRAKPGTPQVNNLESPAPGGGTLLTNNPNGANPQRLASNNPQDVLTCDQGHEYTAEQDAFDNFKMDKFPASTGNANGKSASGRQCNANDVLDYYDGNTATAEWQYAQNFAMSDNSFGTVYGPSTPGALDVTSGSSGDVNVVAGSASSALIPDGKGGQTLYGDTDPYYDDCGKGGQAGLGGQNIGDLLNARGLSWGWFEGGFNPSTAYSGPATQPGSYNPTTAQGKAACANSHPIGSAIGGNGQYGIEKDYIPHHEPFEYYPSTANPHHLAPASLDAVGHDTQSYTDGKPDFNTANHQYDTSVFDNLVGAIDSGQMSPDSLPAVSYLKAPGYQDGHAGYSDPLDEQTFITNEINSREVPGLVLDGDRARLRRFRWLVRPRFRPGQQPVAHLRRHPQRPGSVQQHHKPDPARRRERALRSGPPSPVPGDLAVGPVQLRLPHRNRAVLGRAVHRAELAAAGHPRIGRHGLRQHRRHVRLRSRRRPQPARVPHHGWRGRPREVVEGLGLPDGFR